MPQGTDCDAPSAAPSPQPKRSPGDRPNPSRGHPEGPRWGTKSTAKARNPKRKSKKSKPHDSASASATLIYVAAPVLVQNLPPRIPPVSSYTAPSSASRKARKAAQPVLNEQQMQEWRCEADCPVTAAAVGKYYQRHRICPDDSKAHYLE